MAAKKTSNTQKDQDGGNATADTSSKKEVLSLIDDDGNPKKKVRRNKIKEEAAAKKAAEKAQAEEEANIPRKKTALEEQKSKALDLGVDGSQPKSKKTVSKKSGKSVLPPISSKPDDSEGEEKADLKEVFTGGSDEAGSEGAAASEDKVLHLKTPIVVKELADSMNLKAFMLIKDLMGMDVFANPNQSIEPEVAIKLCKLHGYEVEMEKREKGGGVHKVEEVLEEPPPPPVEEETDDEVPLRAPIITMMGHVDHGKTSLLDFIRKSRIATGEAGGITQHVAAYSTTFNDKELTFLDTPGHAAFAKMRARGANITDIIVLVIAADDGLMPTTMEAIAHAKESGKAMVIAINKCDLPNADVMKVKTQLQKEGLATTDWGGDIECVEVSAKTGDGVDSLLETLLLQAEVMELRANPKGPARAIVVEARTEAGRGPTATVIVETGTLKVGKPFICGSNYGKVKSMISDTGEQLKVAGPSTPVELLGFNGIPGVGDEVVVMDSERQVKKLSSERQGDDRREKLKKGKLNTLEDFMSNIAEGGRKNLKIILKGDVAGSIEAIVGALEEIESEKIRLDIIHRAAGSITESDIDLAAPSEAILIGFNVKVEPKAVRAAKSSGVQVKLYSVIYELIDQVKEAMLGMLDPAHRENVVGHAKVKQVFKLSRGLVAGCVVTDGQILRKARARVLRDGEPVFDGGLATLRRFKEDVGEVRKGLECGIRLGDFNEYAEDDVIECYELERVAQTL